MKKVCVITTTRAEYGQLRWIINDINDDPELELQLIVTGGHLSPEQGLTYNEIEKDGYYINEKIEICFSSVSDVGIVKSMGVLSISICEAFERLKPDLIIILGDRYELLPIANAAVVMRIPIAHIGGGDITEGAIDNEVRNSVTMMSTLHFASTDICANRIIQMLQNNKNVFVTGDRSLDNYRRLKMMDRTELAKSLSIDENKEWILLTYHPETKISKEENIQNLINITNFLDKRCSKSEIIVTKANTDLGGIEINQYLSDYSLKHENVHLFSSLGQLRYNSICFQLSFMIGNSSSGIYESGYCKLPTINVGHRQDGRMMTDNIISVDAINESLDEALTKIRTTEFEEKLKSMNNPYGDGTSSIKIVKLIKQFLYESK